MTARTESLVFVFARAVTYASLFIGFVLVYLPAQILSRSVPLTDTSRGTQLAGMLVAGVGAVIVVWCVMAFVFMGRGTPLPLDAPRRLVVRGPYAYVRNPMYVGAFLALAGAALRFRSLPLALYAVGFLTVLHLVVVLYEEPVLRARFGEEYDAYRKAVGRWIPSAQ
jgi:protein-S-isoprenylcysteine O-methyltransferase Ste14